MPLLDELRVGALPLGIALDEITPPEVKFPPQSIEDQTALKLVTQDTRAAENESLRKGLPSLWDRNERLYQFIVPIQYWEGTIVARAHLGVPLVYEHTESLLPQVMRGIFAESPPFDVRPKPGTSMDEARAHKELIGWALEEDDFKQEVRLMFKQAFIQTSAIGKWGWKQEKRQVRRLVREEPERVLEDGTSVPQEGSDRLVEKIENIEVNRPTFEFIDRRNILVDPTLTRPDIRLAKFVIHRVYMTIEQLDALRDVPGYDIPERPKLIKLMFPPKEVPEPNRQSRQDSISLRSEFAPSPEEMQASVDPLTTPLEVLEYTTKDKVIVVLQRKLVIKNAGNEFGKINYVSMVYSDVPGSFDGLGISSIIGGEQRLQQGVINTRLDDMALRLHGTFIRQRGTNTPTQQIRLRPGGIIDTDTPEGVQLMKRDGAVVDAFEEINASDARAQRRTGANEFVLQGGQPRGTSITRTATGIATIAAGVGARMEYIIENFSDFVFVPVLEAFSEMMSRWLKPSQVQRILSDELGSAFTGDPLRVNNAKVKFSMLAASRLSARAALAQTLPFLMQYLLNGDIINALADQGKKVNIREITKMVFDVSGWPNIENVVEDMTEQEIAQRQASSEAALAAQQQQAQREGAVEQIEARAEGDLVKDITGKLLDSELQGQGE